MTPIALTPGSSPDVAFIDGLVYVAYGADADAHGPARVQVFVFTPQGILVRILDIEDGGFSSFPRFGAPWLAYRTQDALGNIAAGLHMTSGQSWHYARAGATYSLAVNPSVGAVAFEQLLADGWRICFGSLDNGQWGHTPIPGAPDGIDTIVSNTQVTLRNQTRTSVPRMLYPVHAGDLVVGEHADEPGVPQGGVAVQLTGDVVRIINLGAGTPDPRCATDGTTYAIVWWVPGGDVQLWLGTRADVAALPALPAVPTNPEPPNPEPGPEPPEPPDPGTEPPIPPIPPNDEPYYRVRMYDR